MFKNLIIILLSVQTFSLVGQDVSGLVAIDENKVDYSELVDSNLSSFTSIDQEIDDVERSFGVCDSLEVVIEEARFILPDNILTPLDYAPDYSDSVMISRIAAIHSPDLPLRFDNKIRGFIDYFSIRNRDYTRKMMKRSGAYFPIIEQVLKENDMPESIKYLAIVESGLDPKIRSWAGAMGLWQFMPATGKQYGLDYDFYVDERLDPYKSTQAACRYLRQLYNMFGDWELALGAYNCGPGNMRKAIRRSGYKKTFAEVYDYLPKETRSYVPQFMAVNYVMRHLDEHNLSLEDWEYDVLPEHDVLVCNQYLNLVTFTEASGVCKSDLVKLNPEIKRDAVSKDWKDYELKVPKWFFNLSKDSVNTILALSSEKGEEKPNYEYRNPGAIDLSGSNQVSHRVRSGESLGSIANKYGVTVSNIKSWNRLRKSTIYPGQRLKIQVKSTASTHTNKSSAHTKEKVEHIEIPKGEKRIYTVKKGDVLGGIASIYGVTVSQLKEWNKLSSNRINIGQKITVFGGIKPKTFSERGATQQTETKPKNDFKNIKTQNYTVVSGDAIYTIGLKFKMSVAEVKGLNNLKSNNLSPGQVLKVFVPQSQAPKKTPKVTSVSGKTHVVKNGESLWTISRKYEGLTVERLKELNKLNSNNLDVGQVLVIE